MWKGLVGGLLFGLLSAGEEAHEELPDEDLIDLLRRPAFPKKRKLGSDRTFACRCFCALQELSVSEITRRATYDDDSLEIVFDPQPIPVRSLDALAQILDVNRRILGLSGFHDTASQLKLVEMMSGTVVDSPPDLDLGEQLLLAKAVEEIGGDRAYESLYVHSLPDDVRTLIDKFFAARPFQVQEILKQKRLLLLKSPPQEDMDVDGRVECAINCRDEVLRLPMELQRVVPHKTFAMLKRLSDAPSGDLISPESPQWARARPRLPGIDYGLLPLRGAFVSFMRDRWLALWAQAARFDAYTGQLNLDDELGRRLAIALSINASQTCDDLYQKYTSLGQYETSWAELSRSDGIVRNPEEILHPDSLQAKSLATKLLQGDESRAETTPSALSAASAAPNVAKEPAAA